MPGAIDRGITLGLGLSSGEQSTWISTDFQEQIQIDVNIDEKRGAQHWPAYIHAVIAEIKKIAGNCPQLNMVIASDLPIGSGLSSSAALENAVSYGLNECLGLGLEKIDLAGIGQRAENLHIGIDSGIMDQFAGLFGKKDHFIFLDCENLDYKYLKWPFNAFEILLVNSNVQRELVDSQFNLRKQSCKRVAEVCAKHSLRELNMDTLKHFKNEISYGDFRKAMFIIEENKRVQQSALAIEALNAEEIGKLMSRSHIGLRDRYEVSCPELDFLVEEASGHPGVIGSRMMGGGFGGCTINLIERDAIPRFEKAVIEAYHNKFKNSCEIYKVNLSDGTHQMH